jgi:hypothetical protein
MNPSQPEEAGSGHAAHNTVVYAVASVLGCFERASDRPFVAVAAQ